MPGLNFHFFTASTAAALPRSTSETAELAYSNPERRPGGIAFLPRVAVIQGGLPVMTGAGVHIGEGTSIGAGSVVGDYVRIGQRCVLHPRVTVYHDVTVGNHVILHSGCVIGADGFGFILTDGAYVPLVPSDARSQRLLQVLRTSYGRAKATQLAEQARRRYGASVHRSSSQNGSVTIRLRF